MGFTSWLKGMLVGKKTVELTDGDIENMITMSETKELAIEEFAVFTAINFIAGAVSKCEFRTFEKHEEVFKSEHYLWNTEPNKNQNSTQFLGELIARLLYFGECLVIEASGQLIIAEHFLRHEYTLYDSVFTGVSRSNMCFTQPFYMRDVLYFRQNNTNARAIIASICAGYCALITSASKRYSKAGGRKGILKVSALAAGKPDFEAVFEKLMTQRFKNYFNADNAVLPLFDGYEYNEQGTQSGQGQRATSGEIADIKLMTDEIIARVAQAFKISPAILKGDIADIREPTNNALTFCVDPLCDMLKEEINRKRYGEIEHCKGNYLKIDTSCIRHRDIFEVAEKADKLIAARLYSPNEIRRKLGDARINKPWANEYVLTKNYTTEAEQAEKEVKSNE